MKNKKEKMHKVSLICLSLIFSLTNKTIHAADESYFRGISDEAFLEIDLTAITASCNAKRESPTKLEDSPNKRHKLSKEITKTPETCDLFAEIKEEEIDVSEEYQFPSKKSCLEIETIPQERGIWCQNLDYEYEGNVFSTHQWHIQSATNVKSLYKANKLPNGDPINFAKTRIDALFRMQNGKIEIFSYEVPIVFTSSSLNNKESFLSFKEVANDNLSSRSPNNGDEFLRNLQEQDISPQEKKDYYHSEHAFLLYLIKRDEWLKAIKQTIPEEAVALEHLVFVICSYFDPCYNCSRGLYRAQSSDGYYMNLLTQKCRDQKISLQDERLKLFIEVSSLREYSKSRGCLTTGNHSFLYANNIDITTFSPYFAQMHLKISSKKPPIPSYATRTIIKEEHKEEILKKAIAEGDLTTEAEIKYAGLVQELPSIKQELMQLNPELLKFLSNEQQPLEQRINDLKRNARLFIETYSATRKSKTMGERKLDSIQVLSSLRRVISQDMHEDDNNKFKEALRKEKENISTIEDKTSRIDIIGKYCSYTKCAPNGKKITSRTVNAAHLLKIYGYIYWGDAISNYKQVPDNLKKKRGKSTQSQKHLIQILETIDKEEKDELQSIANFLLQELLQGKFEKKSSRYYWYRTPSM